MDNHEKPADADMPGKGDDGAEITAAQYIRALRSHLRNSKPLSAYSVANDALKRFPAHPLIVSYHGMLQSIVDKKHRSAVDACRKALLLFKAEDSYSASVVYPHLYLNLGKAYLAGGKKKEAFEAFQKGLKYERSNPELKQELRRMGMRKAPAISFLSRSNPLNKLLGMFLQKSGKGDQRRV